MRRRETMSTRALRKLCSYWARPDVVVLEGEATDARDDGEELHELARAEIDGDDDGVVAGERALAMMDRLRPILDRLRARSGAEAYSEVAIGYDPATGRSRVFRDEEERILTGLSRDQRDARSLPGEYVGSIDLLLVFRDQNEAPVAIEVADHKTTYVGGEPQDATEQLVTYGTVAADAFGVSESLVYPIVIDESVARIGDAIMLDDLTIGAELADIQTELTADVSNAQPNPGPWCRSRYCKARASCPATQKAMRTALAHHVEPADMLRPNYIPGAGIADLVEEDIVRIHVARKLLEDIEKGMKADERAWLDKHGAVPFPDGSRLVLQPQTTEKANLAVDGAIDVVENAGGGAAIKQSMAWTDLKKLVGEDAEADVREKLRGIHALKISSYSKPVLRPPPKGAKSTRGKRKPKGSLIEEFDEKAKAVLAEADALKASTDERDEIGDFANTIEEQETEAGYPMPDVGDK